ncbi:MAG: hypothetical protein ACQES4_04010 [Bacillota bacterium]
MEKVQGKGKKTNRLLPIIILLVAFILVLLFLLTPLKETFFPAAAEPGLTLLVIDNDGPDSGTGLYQIVVEAQVKGNPEPQVAFARNDGVGETAVNQTLILLEEGETYLLQALATNPQGRAEAELELYAGITVGTSSGEEATGGDTATGEPAPGSGDDETEPDVDLSDETAPDEDEEEIEAGEVDETEPESPRIVDIHLVVGSNTVDLLELPDESYPIRYEEATHIFLVTVEYSSDEELDFQVEVTDGVIVDFGPGMFAGDAPENHWPFTFTWHSPANPAGNLEALNVPISVTASDPFGSGASRVIRLSLLPEPEDGPALSESYNPIATLTGQVNEEGQTFKSSDSSGVPTIYVGDLPTNLNVKGFISFDISELAGKNIVSANLNLWGTAVGNPSAHSGNLGIYSTNYGSSLDSADYSSPVDSIRSFRPGFSDLSFSNNQLRDYIQSVASAGGTHAQFRLEYPSATNNGVADGRSILVQDISLDINYN